MSKGGSIYGVKKTIRHEKFDELSYQYDIGLIQVDSPIEFDEHVQPIEYSAKFIPSNTDLQVLGWGRLWVRDFFY